jgi:hypothetical protein
MATQQTSGRYRRALHMVTGNPGFIMPVRHDGEIVTDPAFALPLPADFIPWERAVAAYLATLATPGYRTAA